MYVYVYVYMLVYTHVCMYLCLWVCMIVSVCLCGHVCACVPVEGFDGRGLAGQGPSLARTGRGAVGKRASVLQEERLSPPGGGAQSSRRRGSVLQEERLSLPGGGALSSRAMALSPLGLFSSCPASLAVR